MDEGTYLDAVLVGGTVIFNDLPAKVREWLMDETNADFITHPDCRVYMGRDLKPRLVMTYLYPDGVPVPDQGADKDVKAE